MQLRHDNADSTIVLVCTDVAARGLDIPNIRHVILHTVPTTVSAFIHQVGRTARKGQDGLLTCLVNTASGDAQKYTHLHALKAASELSF
jgi:superfamily II DNA/RNA helicase